MHGNTGRKHSKEHIAKIAKALTGYKKTDEHRNNISIALKGKKNSLGCKRSLEFRKHLSEYWTDNPNHNLRIDGKGAERNGERQKIMSRLEYRLWREAVFERDNYTCVFCGQIGGQLHADHIKPYRKFPELMFDINNGRTLCIECHKTTDTYAWKMTSQLRKENQLYIELHY